MLHALAFVWDHASGLLCCATVPWTASSSLTSLRKATQWHDLAGLLGVRVGQGKPVRCLQNTGIVPRGHQNEQALTSQPCPMSRNLQTYLGGCRAAQGVACIQRAAQTQHFVHVFFNLRVELL